MIGSWTIIKNEAPWIAAHLSAWLPVLSQMVFFDGNSTDGTLEIIREFIKFDANGHKIKLIPNKDPNDLCEDYVRVSDEAMRAVDCDLAFFCHPDMVPSKLPANFDHLAEAVAASVKVRSFAGEPGGQLFELKGRDEIWKPIYRLRNPDLGAHYYGFYGAWNEDVYFSAITGTQYAHHGSAVHKYPYEVVDSGIEVLHFSDVRPYARRLERMKRCMANQGNDLSLAESHPRVTLKQGDFKKDSFTLEPAEWPAHMIEARAKYKHLERSNLVQVPA